MITLMNLELDKKHGALPSQTIASLIEAGFITGAPIENVRMASLDLSISEEIYKVEGIFQPRPTETVQEVLEKIKKEKVAVSEPLLRNQMYIIKLNERMKLPASVYAYCNPKSTSGRLDLHVRLIADRVSRYDAVTPGWEGELWISVVPKTFSVKLKGGLSLNQLRFFTLDTRLTDLELEIAMQTHKLLWREREGVPLTFEEIKIKDNDGSLILTLDTEGEVVGYEGIESAEIVDASKVGEYDAAKFFKPLSRQGDYVYLKQGSFYILSTSEAVRVPPGLACEMVPMDERSGEFRSHYAGFIDPGWGWGVKGEGRGRPLTLEVRPFEDIIVRHNQPIAKIKFERMMEIPEIVYDAAGSNYTVQSGPRLAKQFKLTI